ncbi:recombinase family protein [Lysinibacillus telephonicus]|uniref:Recombinase family protein n=1 Tax=Lysinibacillus telephonicus TaxID=1714840 RepID=A0A3S0ITR5_9BACI|nr:recombinase family protein [Lysinibacillus telephonicus]RTQ86341.1 recombinase family protein [Lysinibacillus telephonicus]
MQTVAYYRNSISKEKQKLSIIMQRDHVHQLAQNKRLLIDEEYSDDETSARKTETNERKQMTKLLREIEKKNVKTLLVYSRCRIARNVQQYMEIYRTFKKYEIEVIFAAEYEFPMIYTSEGEFIERIMAAFNQHEAENLVKKLRDAKLTIARKGYMRFHPLISGMRQI